MPKATAISFAPRARGKALIDAQTPTHAALGLAAGLLGLDTYLALAVLIGAKIVDASLRDGPAEALFSPGKGQALGNEMTDLLFEVGGLRLGHLLRERMQAAKGDQVATLGHYHHPNHYAKKPIAGLGLAHRVIR